MALKINSLRKFYTLILLKERPRHGYDLMKEIERMSGKSISANQVYPFLNALRKNGIVRMERREERDKKVYSLTKKGEGLVDEIFNRCESIINVAVKSRIKECYNCGCKIYGDGYEMRMGFKKVTFCCEHCAKSFLGSRK